MLINLRRRGSGKFGDSVAAQQLILSARNGYRIKVAAAEVERECAARAVAVAAVEWMLHLRIPLTVVGAKTRFRN